MAFLYLLYRPAEIKRYLFQLIIINSFKCLTILIFTTWLLIATQRNLRNKELVYKFQIVASINIIYVVPSIETQQKSQGIYGINK